MMEFVAWVDFCWIKFNKNFLTTSEKRKEGRGTKITDVFFLIVEKWFKMGQSFQSTFSKTFLIEQPQQECCYLFIPA